MSASPLAATTRRAAARSALALCVVLAFADEAYPESDLSSAPPGLPGTPAAGGRALLDEALRVGRCVVGTFGRPERLDDVAWIAPLSIERTLPEATTADETVPIAWEELATARPRRFDEGSRVLLVVEPLPGWSLWRQRLGRRSALGIARRGEAFLRDPDEATLAGLDRLLALSPEEREGPTGTDSLVRLAAEARLPVALSALEHLGSRERLAEQLDAPASERLAAVLSDRSRPARLREGILELAGRRRLTSLETAVRAASAEGSDVAAAAVNARAGMSGHLGVEEAAQLLTRSEPDVRAAALLHGPPDWSPDPATALLFEDPSPIVRGAAAEALANRRGMAAFDDLYRALEDDAIRGAAARALGSLGAAVVPPLVERIRGADLEAARSPLLALASAGPEGLRALRGIAGGHADPRVRAFARFLLGQPAERH